MDQSHWRMPVVQCSSSAEREMSPSLLLLPTKIGWGKGENNQRTSVPQGPGNGEGRISKHHPLPAPQRILRYHELFTFVTCVTAACDVSVLWGGGFHGSQMGFIGPRLVPDGINVWCCYCMFSNSYRNPTLPDCPGA